jgi:transcriptional regulator with XRE-family HTH domain
MRPAAADILFRRLNQRRQELGMSYAALARLAGLSMTSVVRMLSGGQPHASVSNVLAVANILGMNLDATPCAHANQVREKRAREKAERLVRLVQGTSGLEGQAVDAQTLEAMTRQTVHELMTGSSRQLWAE